MRSNRLFIVSAKQHHECTNKTRLKNQQHVPVRKTSIFCCLVYFYSADKTNHSNILGYLRGFGCFGLIAYWQGIESAKALNVMMPPSPQRVWEDVRVKVVINHSDAIICRYHAPYEIKLCPFLPPPLTSSLGSFMGPLFWCSVYAPQIPHKLSAVLQAGSKTAEGLFLISAGWPWNTYSLLLCSDRMSRSHARHMKTCD